MMIIRTNRRARILKHARAAGFKPVRISNPDSVFKAFLRQTDDRRIMMTINNKDRSPLVTIIERNTGLETRKFQSVVQSRSQLHEVLNRISG